MKYPCLVPKQFCKTDISLSFEREGLNEYGEPLEAVVYSGKCNYQDEARTILTAEKKLVQITGICVSVSCILRICTYGKGYIECGFGFSNDGWMVYPDMPDGK